MKQTKGSTLDAKTLILGCSRDARDIAEELLGKEGDVIVAIPDGTGDTGLFDGLNAAKSAKIEILPVAGPFSCSGAAGHFNLTFTGNGQPATRTVTSIILADAGVRKPNFSLYGVGESSRVVSLSRAREFIESGSGSASAIASGKSVAFVTGLADESNPVITAEIMRCALDLQQNFNQQTYLFTGNLKVAGDGLEALYRQTKDAGTIYLKFTETLPEIEADDNGNVTLTYVDEVIRETFKLNPDVTVIDEALRPSTFARDLAHTLKIDTGPDGFMQSDNVHRATVLTNRTGVFVAGPSRNAQTTEERQADVGNTALSVLGLHKSLPGGRTGKAEINFTGQCVGCLTCFRACPYGAISLNPRVAVDPQACQGCGICTAECPRFAIRMKAPAGEAISDKIQVIEDRPGDKGFTPAITAFCCSRSAAAAGELADRMGYSLPPGLKVIEVPCAGSLSRDHIFSAFKNGSDGVLVLTCHKGNCHSEYGNTYAHRRVNQTSELLAQLGFEAERLDCRTLASTMGMEFFEMVNAFEGVLVNLGPSRLKKK